MISWTDHREVCGWGNFFRPDWPPGWTPLQPPPPPPWAFKILHMVGALCSKGYKTIALYKRATTADKHARLRVVFFVCVPANKSPSPSAECRGWFPPWHINQWGTGRLTALLACPKLAVDKWFSLPVVGYGSSGL